MFNLGLALTYPFKKENWQSTLLWPGLIFIVYFVGQYLISFVVALLFPMGSDPMQPNTTAMMLNMVSNGALTIIFMPFFAGFYWHWAEKLLIEGMEAPPPDWGDHVVKYWLDGLKITIVALLISTPYMLIIFSILLLKQNIFLVYGAMAIHLLVCLFLTPFVLANFIQALPEKRFTALFNLSRIFKTGCKYYGRVLLATLITLVCSIGFVVVMIFSCCTCIGFPVVVAASYAFYVHIMAQAFAGYRWIPETAGES